MLIPRQILEAFHHPHYNNGRSEIQNRMLEVVQQWLGESAPPVLRTRFDLPSPGDLGHSKAQETIGCLTKDAIRQGKNKREGESPDGPGSNAGYSGGYSSGRPAGSYGGGTTQQSKTSYLL
jgi:hypothetical protein